MRYHSLGEKLLERLVKVDQTEVSQCLGEETGIEQVQDGVFYATDCVSSRGER